ncbi:DUF4279 domain-containing protein [Solimonas sp. K1W22B-7]|uniref:DUF4279 domain-containing protein n=1 Tax=Solimonas sp. K1W22B-7 TaxID=2303331 RepID=UPI000E335857|nr:DUF4279 domain-containing protein [Solimonas sp. K1W22B-7]AXQ31414.1 DUF4279 domain-containing protein [Solimonas sp. K1W22B-7]
MTRLARSMLGLRIFGDDLDPDEVTALLGCRPTKAFRKGDLSHAKSERSVPRVTGRWSLNAEPRTPEDFDGQIADIFSNLTDDLTVWAKLGQRFRIDLFCGGFMGDSNEGFSLSVQSLRTLADRGVEFGLDLYAPDTE